MKNFFNHPLMMCTGLVGLTLSMTACATMATPDNKPMGRQDAQNHRPHHEMMDRRMSEHRGKMGMWHRDMGKPMDMQARKNQMMASLNLTDAQKAQVQQLRTQQVAQMQQLQASMRQIDANIDAQKKAGAAATNLVSLYQQKQALKEQATAMHKQHQQQLLRILTPEQQLKFYENQKMPMMMRNQPMKLPMTQPARS